MKMFTTVYKDRLKSKEKSQAERNSKYHKQQKAVEIKRLQKHKQLKKIVYKKLGQMEAKKNSRGKKSSTRDTADE